MNRIITILFALLLVVTLGACSTTYRAAPLPFRAPATLGNSIRIDGAEIGARAYDDKAEARRVFGFDIIGAGMLPVQVVFDNRSRHTFEINGQQSFLEDARGNLWPVLSRDMAYARATQHVQSGQMLRKGASNGLMGAAAGAVVGAAIGIVTGEGVGAAAGKGAAIGGAAGMLGGGVEGYQDREAYRAISEDLRANSLQNKTILPDMLACGVLFYPAEASLAGRLTLQLVETDTGRSHRLVFNLSRGGSPS